LDNEAGAYLFTVNSSAICWIRHKLHGWAGWAGKQKWLKEATRWQKGFIVNIKM